VLDTGELVHLKHADADAYDELCAQLVRRELADARQWVDELYSTTGREVAG
jgi:hypothetical protein